MCGKRLSRQACRHEIAIESRLRAIQMGDKMPCMNTLDYFQTMSRYNRWMNEKLYAVCAAIPDAVRKEDKGAWFRSIHGTLNHLLLGDRIWLSRFQNQPFDFVSLDQELFGDFGDLTREREKTDAAIQLWVDGLSEDTLARPFSMTDSEGQTGTYPMWHLVMHMFNHQTHHRGQLTTLLEQSGFDSGVTDLRRLPGAQLS